MSGGPQGAKGACPQCGRPASGNFCPECGAALGPRFCNQCGAKAVEGASFCNQCGTAFPGARAGGHREAAAATVGERTPRGGIGGAALFAVIAVMGWKMVTPGPPLAPGETPTTQPVGAAAAGTPPDLSSMTPREAADRLYDRVMRTISAGDTAGAMAFQPMGVQAYELAEPLDLDGIYHLAVLELLIDPEAALRTVERILAVEPDHILGLAVVAEAAVKKGDRTTAAETYQTILDVFDAESVRGLVEYQDHRTMLVLVKADAEAFVAGR